MVSDVERQLLNRLEERLDAAFHRIVEVSGQPVAGAFVRLDTRSPKDGVFSLPQVLHLLRSAVLARNFAEDPWSLECQTYDEACVHRAIIAAQRVCSGREAIDLLRHSQRVEADLVIGQVANNGNASSQLVLRRWDERVDPLFEVRAFVCRGRVTAITQYYETCMVPQLLQNRMLISRLVIEAVERVHSRIADVVADRPLYSADFALIPGEWSDSGTGSSKSQGDFKSALLIEINPPPPIAGTVLFDWNNAKDRALLMGDVRAGTALPAVRLVENPVPWTSVPFHPPLRQLVDSLRRRDKHRRRCIICCCKRHKALHMD